MTQRKDNLFSTLKSNISQGFEPLTKTLPQSVKQGVSGALGIIRNLVEPESQKEKQRLHSLLTKPTYFISPELAQKGYVPPPPNEKDIIVIDKKFIDFLENSDVFSNLEMLQVKMFAPDLKKVLRSQIDLLPRYAAVADRAAMEAIMQAAIGAITPIKKVGVEKYLLKEALGEFKSKITPQIGKGILTKTTRDQALKNLANKYIKAGGNTSGVRTIDDLMKQSELLVSAIETKGRVIKPLLPTGTPDVISKNLDLAYGRVGTMQKSLDNAIERMYKVIGDDPRYKWNGKIKSKMHPDYNLQEFLDWSFKIDKYRDEIIEPIKERLADLKDFADALPREKVLPRGVQMQPVKETPLAISKDFSSISKAKASGMSFDEWVRGGIVPMKNKEIGDINFDLAKRNVQQIEKNWDSFSVNVKKIEGDNIDRVKKMVEGQSSFLKTLGINPSEEWHAHGGAIWKKDAYIFDNLFTSEIHTPNGALEYRTDGIIREISNRWNDIIETAQKATKGENVYWPKKSAEDFLSLKPTSSQLKAERDAVKQPAPKPFAPTFIKPAEVKPIVDARKIIKEATIPEVKFTKKGLLQPTTAAQKETLTDKRLLALRFKQQAFGAKAGFKTGAERAKAETLNRQAIKLETAIRAEQLKSLKQGIQMRIKKENIISNLKNKIVDAKQSRGEVVNYIKENLPLKERGKFITMATNAKDKKDVAKAFMRVEARVGQIEIDEGIRKLKMSIEKLKDSPSISADYRNRIKEIVEGYELIGHSEKTIKRLKATADFIARQASLGKDVEMPKRVLNKLKILGRIPKDKITLSQIQGLQQAIELEARKGKTVLKAKRAIYNFEKETRKENLLGIVSGMDSFQPPPRLIGEKLRRWAERYIKTRNYLRRSKVGLTPIDGLAEITGMQPMKADLDLSFGSYLQREVINIPNFKELEEEMLKLGNILSQGQVDRVGVYGARVQNGGYERLANNEITKEEADAIVLTGEEQEFYDAIQKFNEATYPAVKKYMLDEYNVDVGKVENYMSFMTDFDAMNELEIFDRFGDRSYDAVRKLTKKVEEGFTKKRVGAGKQKIQIDARKIAQRHSDDVAYMLTMGRDTKMYFEIVNSPEMRTKLGDVGALACKEWLDLMARKGGSEGAKRIAALDVIRKNLSIGVLAFRLSSALVQLSSFADTAATIGVEWTSKGAYSIATSKEWRAFVMDNFPEAKKAIGDDIAFRELEDVFFAKATKIGMTPLKILDGLMRAVSVAGTYQKLALKKGITIDWAKPDKALIQEATRIMRQSQGSSFFKDQPLALTTGMGITENRSLNKAILTFQSFMLNRWDNINRQIWRLGIKEKNYKKAATSFLLLIVVAAALEEGLRRTAKGAISFVGSIFGDDEQDEDRMSFEAAMTLNALQSVPIAGQIISSLEYSSNPVPIINAIDDVVSGSGQIVKGKALKTKIKGGVRATGAVGSLFGVPGASQATQIIRQSIPSKKGKTQPIGGGLKLKKGALKFKE